MVEVPIATNEMQFIARYAQSAEIGGRSSVRAVDRQEHLNEDQIIGMMGNYALHKYYFGHCHLFKISRQIADQYPNKGDGGSDVPGANIDIKTSLVRTSLPLTKHWLLVRSAERHPATIYVLGLVPPEKDRVCLIGWLTDGELQIIQDGLFKGAFGQQAQYLHPMMPVKWF